MTDNNSNDPLPEDENLGSAGSPHSSGRNLHQRSVDFERNDQNVSAAHCEVCGASIPPTRNRCPDHQRAHSPKSVSESGSWSISNVGLVIVAASSKFHALANASVAFRRRDGGVGSDESFDLIYDFGEPSETLTSGWGSELPDAVELDSARGETLIEKATTKMESRENSTEGEVSGVEIDQSILGESRGQNSFLFTERGETIHEEDQLANFDSGPKNDEHDYWVVPALLYNRRREESGERELEDQNCVNCGVTQHEFDGYSDASGVEDGNRVGIWVCLECGSRKAGEQSENHPEREVGNQETSTAGDEKPINKAEESQFEAVMERLEADNELGGTSESK